MNGHAHLLYALNIAVRTAPDASVKALKYAAAVERSLCEKLCADVNYSGLICKNPFHLEWLVMEWREEAYTLDELADYLDLSASERRSIDKHYGMGRNCHLFEMTRKWAYRAIRQGWPAFSQWLEAVIQRVEMYNASLPVPLSLAECRAIGKSIAKYTHRNFTPETFAQYVAEDAPGQKAFLTDGQIYDLHSGKIISSSELLADLATAQHLIIGEKHDNAEHHQIELWLIQNLLIQRPQGSVLLEMLTSEQQPRVNQVKCWLKDNPVVRDSRVQELLNWQKGWSWEMYGDIVMQLLRGPYPLLNANIGREQILALYKKNEFPKGKKSTAPVVQEALRETIISMHEGNLESQQLTSMLSIQQQRDRYMARQLLSAPVPSLLIAGGYHASKSMGVPLHMEDLATGTHPVVLMLAEKGMNITVDHADYVWFVAPDTTKR